MTRRYTGVYSFYGKKPLSGPPPPPGGIKILKMVEERGRYINVATHFKITISITDKT